MNKNIYNEQSHEPQSAIWQSICGIGHKIHDLLTGTKQPPAKLVERRTLAQIQEVSESDKKIIMIAAPNELTLIEKTHRNDTMLLATVLSMLSTRFGENGDSEKKAVFEKQISELDRHGEALCLYSTEFNESYDLPHPREYIESLMKLPKMLEKLFSDAGYSLTVCVPHQAPNNRMVCCFEAFAQRTGIRLEAVRAD